MFNLAGKQVNTSTGMFARTIVQLKPGLPVEDEARLQDQSVLKEFLEKVSRYKNLESIKEF